MPDFMQDFMHKRRREAYARHLLRMIDGQVINIESDDASIRAYLLYFTKIL